jgi:hypothetical protein
VSSGLEAMRELVISQYVGQLCNVCHDALTRQDLEGAVVSAKDPIALAHGPCYEKLGKA